MAIEPGGFGQPQQAIGAPAVARASPGIRRPAAAARSVTRSSQLHLAEGAARLLVGQDVLQPDHLGRKLGQVLLRGVDHGQALPQLGERLAGLLGRLLELLSDLLAEQCEALLDGLGKRPLLALQPLGEQGLARGLRLAELREAPASSADRPLAAPGAPGHEPPASATSSSAPAPRTMRMAASADATARTSDAEG